MKHSNCVQHNKQTALSMVLLKIQNEQQQEHLMDTTKQSSNIKAAKDWSCNVTKHTPSTIQSLQPSKPPQHNKTQSLSL